MENGTLYAYKLQHIKNPTFDNVQQLARTFIKDLPQPMVDEIYDDLNRGVDQLTTEQQMLVYLHAFGNMHQAKLNRAFEQLPDDFLQQPEIDIIDYGCGQSIGTMCYADFLDRYGSTQNVRSITLIEPSAMCLDRAELHTSFFFPASKIHTICKSFDDLTPNDFPTNGCGVTLHILSNILDIQCFNLERFANLICHNLHGYNLFVCVGPFFHFPEKDNRMTLFANTLGSNTLYSQFFEKGELVDSKNWTAQIQCSEVGEMPYIITTKATHEEIMAGVGSSGGVYSSDGKRLLQGCGSELTKIEIRKGTIVICNDAFNEHIHLGIPSYLQQITIPDSVLSIGNSAFNDCSMLKKISIPKSLVSIGNGAFIGCKSLQNIKVPNTVTAIGEAAFFCCKSLKTFSIPNLITDIKKNTFLGCDSLKQINIPNSVISIGEDAFQDCKSLQEIIIPNSVTNIGKGAFAVCKSLQHVIIPNSVIRIGCDAFTYCESLQNFTIPNAVTYIGERTFLGCKSLQQIIIPNSVTVIGDGAFSYCKSLEKITIPNSVTRIENGSFFSCESLQQINIPNSVTNIGENPFVGCIDIRVNSESTRFVVQDEMLIDIEENRLIAYFGHKTSVLIPNSVNTIGDRAFQQCKSLEQVIIPNTVTKIGNEAFFDCLSLQQINIPDSVISIGEYAFWDFEKIGNFFDRWCNIQQIIISESSAAKFKKILPNSLWDKLYCLKKL